MRENTKWSIEVRVRVFYPCYIPDNLTLVANSVRNSPPGDHKRTGDRRLLNDNVKCLSQSRNASKAVNMIALKSMAGGAANNVVAKGPFWFFVANGPRGHRGPRVIGVLRSGFSIMLVSYAFWYPMQRCNIVKRNVFQIK